MRIFRLLLAMLVGLATVLGVAMLVSFQADAGVKTLTPVADTYLNQAAPDTNYGSIPRISVDHETKYFRQSLLRFTLPTLAQDEVVTSAHLKMTNFDTGATGTGVTAYTVPNGSWNEFETTWNNKPAAGTYLGASGPVAVNATLDIDVTAGTPPTAGTTVSYLLDTAAPMFVGIKSRESNNPPQLVLATAVVQPSSTPTPTPTDTSTPTPTVTQTPADDPVVWAVGDMCDPTTHRCSQVADLIRSDATTDDVLQLGDLAYEDGTQEETVDYDVDFGSKTFADGRTLKSISLPAPGNHEYHTLNADPYFQYWGAITPTYTVTQEPWYAKDVGNWRVISVDSNYAAEPTTTCSAWCKLGGDSTKYPYGLSATQAGAQRTWLAQQLDAAAAAGRPTIVFEHHPALTDGGYTPGTKIGRDLFMVAATHGADLFMSGHEHNYFRYAARDGNGNLASNGTVQFVVGTGGRSLTQVSGGTFAVNVRAFGALRLVLHPHSYDFVFEDLTGAVKDSGNGVSAP